MKCFSTLFCRRFSLFFFLFRLRCTLAALPAYPAVSLLLSLSLPLCLFLSLALRWLRLISTQGDSWLWQFLHLHLWLIHIWYTLAPLLVCVSDCAIGPIGVWVIWKSKSAMHSKLWQVNYTLRRKLYLVDSIADSISYNIENKLSSLYTFQLNLRHLQPKLLSKWTHNT